MHMYIHVCMYMHIIMYIRMHTIRMSVIVCTCIYTKVHVLGFREQGPGGDLSEENVEGLSAISTNTGSN